MKIQNADMVELNISNMVYWVYSVLFAKNAVLGLFLKERR